jgi:hypothetical protein
MYLALLQIILLLSSLTLVTSQNATTINGADCVDTSGFNTCINNAEQLLVSCVAGASSDNARIACSIGTYIAELGCYLKSCWNKVWQ